MQKSEGERKSVEGYFPRRRRRERKGKERGKGGGGSNILRRRWETEVGGYFFTPPSLHQEEWRGILGDFLHKRRIMLSTYV